jgi:hypothetical protein
VGVHEVRSDRAGKLIEGVIMLFYRKANENLQLCTGLIVHHRTVSAVNGLVFDRNRASYIALGVHWCKVIVLNVRASSEEKCDDSEDRI